MKHRLEFSRFLICVSSVFICGFSIRVRPRSNSATNRTPMKHYGNLPKLEDFQAYKPSAAAVRMARERHVELPDTLTRGQRIASWLCCGVAAAIMLETLPFKLTRA